MAKGAALSAASAPGGCARGRSLAILVVVGGWTDGVVVDGLLKLRRRRRGRCSSPAPPEPAWSAQKS